MKTTNFDFLKNFNEDAYEIALQIEDEITSSPASIKTYATTFLECIVEDMISKSGIKNMNPFGNFTPKVKKLTRYGIIKFSFETMLISAYSMRNTAHYSLRKTPEEDKKLVLELHKKLFHISWRYFNEFGGNEFGYIKKPCYNNPVIRNVNVKSNLIDIKKHDNIFSNCIICGQKNNSKHYNICNRCTNKVHHIEDLISIKDNFMYKFNRRNILELGYSKHYTNILINKLLEYKLIFRKNNFYHINSKALNHLLFEIKEYNNIEILLNEFISGKLSYEDIKESEYYKKGQNNIKPYVQVYKIVSDAILNEFTNQLSLNIPIDEIIENTKITHGEIDSWCEKQMKLAENGFKNNEFINYNKLIIDSYLDLRRKGLSADEIRDKLNINERLVNFWFETSIKELFYFRMELDDIKMDLILDYIQNNKTKDEIYKLVDIDENELERLLNLGSEGDKKYELFYKIFTNEYEFKRKNKFLYYLKRNSLSKSIEKSYLSKKDVDEWYSLGEKHFAEDRFDKYSNFYIDVTKRLMKLYIKYRENFVSKDDACNRIDKKVGVVDKWLNCNDHKIFTDFQLDFENLKVNILIDAMNKKSSLKKTLDFLSISKSQFYRLLGLGEDCVEKYVKLYETYMYIYIPYKLDVFLKYISKNSKKYALNKSELSQNEIDKFYKLGIEGIEPYNKFSDVYFKFKLGKYLKFRNKGKNNKNALKNAEINEVDLKYRSAEIQNEFLKMQINKATKLIRLDESLKSIMRKVNIDCEELFEWYIRGWQGDKMFHEFSEAYYFNRIGPFCIFFQMLFDLGISDEFIFKYILEGDEIKEFKFIKTLYLFNFTNKKLSESEEIRVFCEKMIMTNELKFELDSIKNMHDIFSAKKILSLNKILKLSKYDF